MDKEERCALEAREQLQKALAHLGEAHWQFSFIQDGENTEAAAAVITVLNVWLRHLE